MNYGLGDELINAQNELADLRLLRAEVRLMLCDLREAGFGDEDADINGGDVVDLINERFDYLKLLAEK